jgi:glutamate/tyrosine decarboxylase-like PLP-dependent enzyme
VPICQAQAVSESPRADCVQDFSQLFKPLEKVILDYRGGLDESPALPQVSSERLKEEIFRQFSFVAPVDREEVIQHVARLMATGAVHTTHPRYFGLFNPDVMPISVAADAMVAAFNPQLAAFSHNPAANLMEQHVLGVFRRALGWPDCHGTFTSGGSEANHSAVIAALTDRFEDFTSRGARRGSCLYVSAEAHHSFVKIAHACGLGRDAIREVPVQLDLRMDVDALRRMIAEDSSAGRWPFAVVATAGTTAAGVIDPITEIARTCQEHSLWLHVDAAWGGAALISRKLKPLLLGIELADSVTIDAHKWFSVPMGAGMFFCRSAEVALRAFGAQTSYMPAAAGLPDPYLSTIQWSRRFIGLKLFMAMAELGLDGYERIIDHQAAMGDYLREWLSRAGFEIVNETRLPLVCFRLPGQDSQAIADAVQAEGSAWISRTTLSHYGDVLRACITNYRTQPSDIDFLIGALRRGLAS